MYEFSLSIFPPLEWPSDNPRFTAVPSCVPRGATKSRSRGWSELQFFSQATWSECRNCFECVLFWRRTNIKCCFDFSPRVKISSRVFRCFVFIEIKVQTHYCWFLFYFCWFTSVLFVSCTSDMVLCETEIR